MYTCHKQYLRKKVMLHFNSTPDTGQEERRGRIKLGGLVLSFQNTWPSQYNKTHYI